MACISLFRHGCYQLSTDMLQVVNRLAATCSHQTWCKLSTSLLQVFNRLAASCSIRLVKLVIHKLAASCFNKLYQGCKWQVATRLIFTGLSQLDDINKLVATCWQLENGRQNWQLATSLWRFWLCSSRISHVNTRWTSALLLSALSPLYRAHINTHVKTIHYLYENVHSHLCVIFNVGALDVNVKTKCFL